MAGRLNQALWQAIRRSIKGGGAEPKPHHLSITPKSAIAILPPKKVGVFALGV